MTLQTQVRIWKLAVVGCFAVMVLMAWWIRSQKFAMAELSRHAIGSAKQTRYLVLSLSDPDKGDTNRNAVLCLLHDAELENLNDSSLPQACKTLLNEEAQLSRTALKEPFLAETVKAMTPEHPELGTIVSP